MSGSRKRIIFVVGNDVQLQNAQSVCHFLDPSDYQFFNLWTVRLEDTPTGFSAHTAGVNATRLQGVVRHFRDSAGDVVVLPQDVGLLQRIIVRRAKKAGASTVLMPDGVVSAGGVPNGSFLRRAVRVSLNQVLRAIGLVEGRAGDMGSSRPTKIFTWGHGWEKAFDSMPGTDVIPMGCPRMDDLNVVRKSTPRDERRILICSQPLSIPSWSRPYAARWYSFLERAMTQELPGAKVRVRLHPAERRDALVPSTIMEAQEWGPLRQDIEWSTIVMAPFSTVLVEALAAHRPIVALSPSAEFSKHAKKYPFFEDARVEERSWNLKSLDPSPLEYSDLGGLRNDFIAFAGSSGERIAAALKQMANA